MNMSFNFYLGCHLEEGAQKAEDAGRMSLTPASTGKQGEFQHWLQRAVSPSWSPLSVSIFGDVSKSFSVPPAARKRKLVCRPRSPSSRAGAERRWSAQGLHYGEAGKVPAALVSPGGPFAVAEGRRPLSGELEQATEGPRPERAALKVAKKGCTKMADNYVNAMARLNQYCQRNNFTLSYNDVGVEGPPHDRVFTAMVSINNRKYNPATGKSKKEARGHAAELAWKTIEQELEADSASRQPQRPLPSPSPPGSSQAPPSAADLGASPLPSVNYIYLLNVYKQQNNVDIEYIWGNKSGTDHMPIFSVACKIGNTIFPEGTGGTKQAAKLNAARLAYEQLNSQPTSRTEQSATPSNSSGDTPFSDSQEVSEATEEVVKSFASDTSDSVIFQDSGASPSATDSGFECKSSVDKLGDLISLDAVKLNETPSSASPKGPVTKPKRKEKPLAPRFSNLHQKESKYTVNERFLDAYEEIQRIGVGAFGNVFKAKHVVDDRVCAVKRVALSCEEEETEEETQGEKAIREVQVLAKLVHENIVRYYTCWIGKDSVPSEDSSISDDSLRKTCECLFIEMEFCENKTLAAWISKHRSTQSHEDSLKKFQQIVEGVRYIHSQDIIHRDLKPLNIFISKDDKIKIGDFGLATSGIDDLLVARTENRGTTLYMAPEQMGSTYGKEVDIFALGLIFFEMIYVFQSFHEKSNEWKNIRDCKFPQAFVIKFPKEKSIISKLLSKNPDERTSATELLNMLKNDVDSVHTCLKNGVGRVHTC